MIPTKIIIHCSDSPNGGSVTIKDIDAWHRARNFDSCGYHMVILPSGEVQNGRGLNQVGAHCEGENHDSIGICLIGKDKFTKAQFKALHYKIESILMTYPTILPWNIFGHYQFPSAVKQGKKCPNMLGNELLYWYHYDSLLPIKKYLMEGV